MRRADHRALALAVLLPLFSGCSETTRPEYVDGVSLSRDSAHVSVGESLTVSASPLDPRGSPLPDRAQRVIWTSTVPGVAVLQSDTGASVTIRGVGTGTATLRATLGRGRGEMPIYVYPADLSRIAIVPDPVRMVRLERVAVAALIETDDGASVPVSSVRVSWAMEDTTVAIVSSGTSGATIFARQVGETRLRLVVSDRSVTVPVIVNPPPPASPP